MTTAEVRDLLLLAAIIGLALLFALTRRGAQPGPLPPAVAPQQQPLEEQVRDVRHRVASVEQHATRLPDHEVRLRRVESEVAEVRTGMAGLREGQLAQKESLARIEVSQKDGLARIERQVNMLVDHHIEREAKT